MLFSGLRGMGPKNPGESGGRPISPLRKEWGDPRRNPSGRTGPDMNPEPRDIRDYLPEVVGPEVRYINAQGSCRLRPERVPGPGDPFGRPERHRDRHLGASGKDPKRAGAHIGGKGAGTGKDPVSFLIPVLFVRRIDGFLSTHEGAISVLSGESHGVGISGECSVAKKGRKNFEC